MVKNTCIKCNSFHFHKNISCRTKSKQFANESPYCPFVCPIFCWATLHASVDMHLATFVFERPHTQDSDCAHGAQRVIFLVFRCYRCVQCSKVMLGVGPGAKKHFRERVKEKVAEVLGSMPDSMADEEVDKLVQAVMMLAGTADEETCVQNAANNVIDSVIN